MSGDFFIKATVLIVALVLVIVYPISCSVMELKPNKHWNSVKTVIEMVVYGSVAVNGLLGYGEVTLIIFAVFCINVNKILIPALNYEDNLLNK